MREATVEDLPALTELFSHYRTFYRQPVDLPKNGAFLTLRCVAETRLSLSLKDQVAYLPGSCSFIQRIRRYLQALPGS